MSNFKLKIKSPLWILVAYLLVICYNQTFASISIKKSSMLHKIMLIGHCHSTQFMEKHNLGIKTLERNTSAANVFLKIMLFGHSHST